VRADFQRRDQAGRLIVAEFARHSKSITSTNLERDELVFERAIAAR
jgi:hypothetical protein